MDRSPFEKRTAEELFENNPIDEFGLAGQNIPLVFSTLAYLDQAGIPTVRLQTKTDGSTPPFNFAITPYAATRLAVALADLVNHIGHFQIEMTVVDPDRGVMTRLPKAK